MCAYWICFEALSQLWKTQEYSIRLMPRRIDKKYLKGNTSSCRSCTICIWLEHQNVITVRQRWQIRCDLAQRVWPHQICSEAFECYLLERASDERCSINGLLHAKYLPCFDINMDPVSCPVVNCSNAWTGSIIISACFTRFEEWQMREGALLIWSKCPLAANI